MMWWYGPGYGMWGGGFIFMLFFWILIIILIVSLVRSSKKGESPMDKTPLQILQERYAKGEIDKKEYEEKKKDLS